MIDVSVKVQMDGVYAALRRLRAVEVEKVFRHLRGPARFDQHRHDRDREGPDGRWPALAPSTVARRRHKRGRDKKGRNRSWPKKLLGRLPEALASVATHRSLIMHSRVKPHGFGLVHQAGGYAGRGARIPRRQFLWVSGWLRREVKHSFQLALFKAWRGR